MQNTESKAQIAERIAKTASEIRQKIERKTYHDHHKKVQIVKTVCSKHGSSFEHMMTILGL